MSRKMRFFPASFPSQATRGGLLSLILLAAALLPRAHAKSPEEPRPPKFRLPTFALPVDYEVHLTLTPDKDTFTGSIDIDLSIKESTSVLWLNANQITVERASLFTAGQNLTAKVLTQPKDLVGFSFEHAVGAGPAKLHIAYRGEISRKDMAGIFKIKDGDHWYIYSQFEDISARRAFPCFDEPTYKVPWKVTLSVPQGDGAFSNTPMVSEANDANGMKTVHFAATKPLPSYLVAMAVGPMDIVDAGSAGAKHTPIRIIVPRGRAAEAEYVAHTTPEILNLLEKYFAIPYPYEKLDEVAIPLAGYAMEHPGLVTYGAGFFLEKPEHATLYDKRLITSVIAHELAHQWFGDLVTMAWWDDTWLNEGFASWMANKILLEYRPAWKAGIEALNDFQRAMKTDELISARKVRQPIESNDDIANAFDDTTYNKGAAILTMFESYMGPDRFQRGIRRYLLKYSWGNATSADFLDSLSGEDHAVAKAFSTFLDQAGVPLVTVKQKCQRGAPQLELSQQRFVPRGSQSSPNELWNIPVCVKYPEGTGEARQCMLMTTKMASLALSRAQSCPAWTYANAGEAGYYRVLYTEDNLSALLKTDHNLSEIELVGLIGDIAVLTKAYMPLGEAMALVPKFAHSPSRTAVSKTLSIASGLGDHLVPAELKPQYQRYLSDLYKQRALDLGWKDRANENPEDRLLRPVLVDVMANEAEDPAFVEEASKLAQAWLEDHTAVDRDMVGVVLNSAAQHGDQPLFDRLHAQAKIETDERLEGRLFTAMGSFRDPAIIKRAVALLLTDEFDIRQSLDILFAATSDETRDVEYGWLKQNWDSLVAKMPTDYGASIPFAVEGYCDRQHLEDAKSFFTGRATKFTGGPRNLDQALERISLCIANKEANQPSVTEFLQSYQGCKD
jgi:cytosol alanyl aminopeptidase